MTERPSSSGRGPAPGRPGSSRREHQLLREMIIPLGIDQVFEFFADARNLERITPPELRFDILDGNEIEMAEGTLLTYRLLLFRIPFRWKTLISHWDPPHSFIDIQLGGPYRKWEHTHAFTPAEGGTRVVDRVVYELPIYPLGEVALPVIRWQLERIFDYRQLRLRELLG